MNEVVEIDVSLISANKHQPRLDFNDDALADLALSIKHNGLLQPIVVRKEKEGYEIIAGERRFRACKLNNYQKVPCLIIESSESKSAQLALIENIQRQDLSAIEEAKAYVNLIKTCNLTQDEVAKQVGKSQASIANKIRLLQLPDTIQEGVVSGKITERHARALLSVDKENQVKVYKKILKSGFNVKKTEDYIDELKNPKDKPIKKHLKGISKNVKLAMNTINQAVKMIERSGIKAAVEEDDNDNEVIMIIRIKK